MLRTSDSPSPPIVVIEEEVFESYQTVMKVEVGVAAEAAASSAGDWTVIEKKKSLGA